MAITNHALPYLSITDGPGKRALILALNRSDFSNDLPVFFTMNGFPHGISMQVRKLECVGDSGDDFIVAGWWLNNPGPQEIIQMTYNAQTRSGKLTHLC